MNTHSINTNIYPRRIQELAEDICYHNKGLNYDIVAKIIHILIDRLLLFDTLETNNKIRDIHSRLITEFHADSLDRIEIGMCIEDTFNIVILPETTISQSNGNNESINDIIIWVQSKISELKQIAQ